MTKTLRADEAIRPELFIWEGPVEATAFDTWLATRPWKVPADLAQLWRRTGGGDLFESETLLFPFGGDDLGDNADKVNAAYRAHGLPDDYFVFHVGLVVSVVRQSDQRYVCLHYEDLTVESEYGSLDEWYRSCLRAEYGERYGLPEVETG